MKKENAIDLDKEKKKTSLNRVNVILSDVGGRTVTY